MGVVLLLKLLINMDCLWDLVCYGGVCEYIGLFVLWLYDMVCGICFFVGYFSVGFVWVVLYFFVLMVCLVWWWCGLLVGLVVGVIFGLL